MVFFAFAEAAAFLMFFLAAVFWDVEGTATTSLFLSLSAPSLASSRSLYLRCGPLFSRVPRWLTSAGLSRSSFRRRTFC